MSAKLGIRTDEPEGATGRRVLLGPEEQDIYTGLTDLRREAFGEAVPEPAEQVPIEHYEKPPQVQTQGEEEPIGSADVVIYGCVPPFAVGCLVCFFTFVEGVVLLLHVTEVVKPKSGLFYALYVGDHPFASTEERTLWIVCIADLIAVIVGIVGLAKSYRGNAYHKEIGAVLLWRVLVTLGSAPWVGIVLAFADDSVDKIPYIVGAMVFFLFNAMLIYGLARFFAVALLDAGPAGERERQRLAEERRTLLQHAYSNHLELIQEEPTLFGCLPLEFALGLWTFGLFVACVVCMTSLLLTHDLTIGGWAFAIGAPYVSLTRRLELLTYLHGAVGALIAFACIVNHYRTRKQEAEALASLASAADYSHELAQAMQSKKRITFAILVFFIVSLFRIACFIPITGMAVVAKDWCGVYVHGLEALSTQGLVFGGFSNRCSASDLGAFVAVTMMAVVDVYVLWGIYNLWWVYRGSISRTTKAAEAWMLPPHDGASDFTNSYTNTYGAVGGVPPTGSALCYT